LGLADFICFLILFLYFFNLNENEVKEQKNELKILTDKESYKEGEEIRMSVLFSCSQEFENVKVK